MAIFSSAPAPSRTPYDGSAPVAPWTISGAFWTAVDVVMTYFRTLIDPAADAEAQTQLHPTANRPYSASGVNGPPPAAAATAAAGSGARASGGAAATPLNRPRYGSNIHGYSH